jgi:hypothetical protein
MIETCARTYTAEERAALTGRWAWGGGDGGATFDRLDCSGGQVVHVLKMSPIDQLLRI